MSRYKYFISDNKVVCVSSFAKRAVRGIAKCAPDDKFNVEIGKKLAKLRCDEKVADKRANRALEKYIEAEELLYEATKYFYDMKGYYLDSEHAHDEAIGKLISFERELKNS